MAKKDRTIEYILSLKDKVSAEYKRVGDSVGTVDAQMIKASGTTEKFSEQLKKAGEGAGVFNSRLLSMAPAAAAVAAVAASIGAVVKAYSEALRIGKEYEQSLANLRAIVNPTSEDFKKLADQARYLGATTKFSATEASDAFTELAKLGLSTNQILASSEAVLNMAAASGENLSAVAESVAGTLAQFRLEAGEAGRVTDVMTASFGLSALNMQRFTEAMKYAGPEASNLGMSIEQTTAAVSVLADNMITGGQAGTALRNIFNELGNQNSKVSKLLQANGIPATATMAEKLEALKPIAKDSAQMFELFGLRAKTAASILIQSTDDLKKYEAALNDAGGTAKRMADIQMTTLSGSMFNFRSAMEEAKLSLFETFGQEATNLVDLFTQKALQAAEWIKKNSESLSFWANAVTEGIAGAVRFAQTAWNILKSVFNAATATITGIVGVLLKSLEDAVNGALGVVNKGLALIGKKPIEFRLDWGGDVMLQTAAELGKDAGQNFADAFSAITGRSDFAKLSLKKSTETGGVVTGGAGASRGEDLLDMMAPQASEQKVTERIEKVVDKTKEAQRLFEDLRIATLHGYEKELAEAERTYAEKAEIIKATIDDEVAQRQALYFLQVAHEERLEEIERARHEAQLARIQEIADKTASYFQQVAGIATNFYQAEINDIERRKNADLEALQEQHDQGLMSRRDYQAARNKIDRDATDEQRKLHRKQKNWAIAQAVIDGANAAIKSFLSAGGWPFGLLPMSLSAATTAAQVRLIESQNFATGGFPQGGFAKVTMNERGQESILNASATQRLGRKTIDEINRGGSVGNSYTAGDVVFNVTITSSDQQMIRRELEMAGDRAIREQARMLRRMSEARVR